MLLSILIIFALGIHAFDNVMRAAFKERCWSGVVIELLCAAFWIYLACGVWQYFPR